MDDMADALLLPPPQVVLLMLVMVLTQALGGSALGRLGAWNDDIVVSASYTHTHTYI